MELQPVVLVYFAILLSRKSEGAMTGEVVLHVYDVTNSESGRTNSAIRRLNKILRDGMGIGGIFHGAIQVAHHSYANSFFFFSWWPKNSKFGKRHTVSPFEKLFTKV